MKNEGMKLVEKGQQADAGREECVEVPTLAQTFNASESESSRGQRKAATLAEGPAIHRLLLLPLLSYSFLASVHTRSWLIPQGRPPPRPGCRPSHIGQLTPCSWAIRLVRCQKDIAQYAYY